MISLLRGLFVYVMTLNCRLRTSVLCVDFLELAIKLAQLTLPGLFLLGEKS